jgi:hypothetical protein
MSNNVKVINSFKVLLLQANAWCLAVFSGHHLGSHPPCHEGEVRTLWAKECTGLQFRKPPIPSQHGSFPFSVISEEGGESEA